MKKITILFLLFGITFYSLANSLVEQGNTAYSAGEFEKAAHLYKDAINQNGESATVYYNLGNAYYRFNQVPSAILSYERALLLEPGNKDIRFNLEIARLKTVDKIEPAGVFFLVEWCNNIRNQRTTDQWSYMAIASFVLLIACLFLFFFSRSILLKKIGFFTGLFLILLCTCSNIFAYSQKKKLTERRTAIIFSLTTTIKSTPDGSGTDLFILHEGTKVKVKNSLGDWSEIEMPDGNIGWIPTKEIEII